jgi:hypothetical protein
VEKAADDGTGTEESEEGSPKHADGTSENKGNGANKGSGANQSLNNRRNLGLLEFDPAKFQADRAAALKNDMREPGSPGGIRGNLSPLGFVRAEPASGPGSEPGSPLSPGAAGAAGAHFRKKRTKPMV